MLSVVFHAHFIYSYLFLPATRDSPVRQYPGSPYMASLAWFMSCIVLMTSLGYSDGEMGVVKVKVGVREEGWRLGGSC